MGRSPSLCSTSRPTHEQSPPRTPVQGHGPEHRHSGNRMARSRRLRAYRRWCQVASAIKMTIRSPATTIRVCGCNPNDRIRSVIIIFEMKPMTSP